MRNAELGNVLPLASRLPAQQGRQQFNRVSHRKTGIISNPVAGVDPTAIASTYIQRHQQQRLLQQQQHAVVGVLPNMLPLMTVGAPGQQRLVQVVPQFQGLAFAQQQQQMQR